MLQFEFLRGPLDWGFRLLGQAPGVGFGMSHGEHSKEQERHLTQIEEV